MSNKPIYSFEDFKNNFVNTLTLKNNYKDNDEYWVYGYNVMFDFLCISNLNYAPEPYPPRKLSYELYTKGPGDILADKQTFDKYLSLKLADWTHPDGVESLYTIGYYSNFRGRVVVWDEYGIDFDDNNFSPITLNELKSYNFGYVKPIEPKEYTYEKVSIDDFVNHIKEYYPQARFYISHNADLYSKNNVSEIVRVRDYVRIVTKKCYALHENTSKTEALSDHKLYEILTTRVPLYREICRNIDFGHMYVAYLSDDYPENMFHKVETEIDERIAKRNYHWEFEISGSLVQKKRNLDILEDAKTPDIYKFNTLNRHYRDSLVSFDEERHQYAVGGKILQSVTTLVENCFTQFDAEYFSKKKAIELGISTQEVLDMWERKGKESRDLGTAMHKKIEKFYLNVISEEDETFRLFKMFAAQVKLAPYRTEWAVYDDEHGIAGTIDFVDYQNGKYIIYDWKRSAKIIADGQPIKVNRFGKKAKFPITHINDTTYYHYALQLSLYRYILEKNYGIQISDLRLGIFHPTYDRPYVISLPYLEKEVIAILDHRNNEHTLR